MRQLILAMTLAAATHTMAQTMAPSTAQTAGEPNLLTVLSSCDSTFFGALQARQKSLEPRGRVQERGAAATFPVPNISHPSDSKVFFNKPLRLHGLDVIGYFDELTPIPGGVAVSWGFLFSATVAETVARVGTSIWDASRLRQGEVSREMTQKLRPDFPID